MSIVSRSLRTAVKASALGDIWLFVRRQWIKSSEPEGAAYAKAPLQILAEKDASIFFGYHDKTPFSVDGSRILASSVRAPAMKYVSEGSEMKVGFFQASTSGRFNDKFVPIGTTQVWSWQQGCMLQWLPTEPRDSVVFNTITNGRYTTVVMSADNRNRINEFEHPLFALDPRGQYGISLNLSRLARLRPGYGCGVISDETEGMAAPEEDGLILFEIESGRRELVVSLADLASQVSVENAEHYVNHATSSPDGRQVVFFHIWRGRDGRRSMRLMTYDRVARQCRCLESEKTVSHYCWMDHARLLATVRAPGEQVWSYEIYGTDESSMPHETGVPLLTDGHPMRSPTVPGIFVADTRLDRRRDDRVVLFDLNGPVIEAGRFCIPYRFDGPTRCDLHPRFDRTGNRVCVDIIRGKRRAMAILDVGELITEFGQANKSDLDGPTNRRLGQDRSSTQTSAGASHT